MLATLPELKSRIRATGTVAGGSELDDAELDRILAAASGRITGLRPERTLEPRGSIEDPVEVTIPVVAPQRIVQVPDLRELVSIELRSGYAGDVVTPLTPSGFTLRRRGHEVAALWLKFRTPLLFDGELVIAGAWGPAAVHAGEDVTKPAAHVSDACLVWAARAWHNRTSRFADTMQDPAGSIASYFRNLPPDVKATLDSLQVPGL